MFKKSWAIIIEDDIFSIPVSHFHTNIFNLLFRHEKLHFSVDVEIIRMEKIIENGFVFFL